MTPEGITKQVAGLCRWFTNLSLKKPNNKTTLWRRYYDDSGNPTSDALERYQKYDNYDAINVDKVADIPIDYYGVMGVPITVMDKYNPSDTDVPKFNGVSLEGDLADYFEILDGLNRYSLLDTNNKNEWVRENKSHMCNINGVPKYFRILIKRKDETK